MGRHGTIIHRGVTDDDGQGQGGGAGDLPARDALGLRQRTDPRRVGDPLRDRQEESVERLDGDRLEPPAGRGGARGPPGGGGCGGGPLCAPPPPGAEGGGEPRLRPAPPARFSPPAGGGPRLPPAPPTPSPAPSP